MTANNLNWQKKVLPFIQTVIILLIAFYLITSIYQFNSMSQRVEQYNSVGINKFIGTYNIDNAIKNNLSKDDKEWLAQCFFESYLLDSRQRNIEYLTISRTWIKYLGFVTGMILCMVGAIFVLGKLNDDTQSTFQAESGNSKFGLKSHSPGIIIAGFGTLLILCTILSHQYIEREDAAVYFYPKQSVAEPYIKELIKKLPDSILNKHPNEKYPSPDSLQ